MTHLRETIQVNHNYDVPTMSYLQAFAILEGWTWPCVHIDFTGCQVETAKVLTSFLSQSHQLGGTLLLELFWARLAACHTQMGLHGEIYQVYDSIISQLVSSSFRQSQI
jgi:hypothetical protein